MIQLTSHKTKIDFKGALFQPQLTRINISGKLLRNFLLIILFERKSILAKVKAKNALVFLHFKYLQGRSLSLIAKLS